MALIEGRDMFSSIRNTARFCLLLPEEGADKAAGTLYLLPVRRGLATDWVRYTGIEELAREMNLAVVMPEGLSSDFCNMAYGMKWGDYLTEELPEYLQKLFGIRKDACLCFGAEMGGEASIRLGLRCPDRFQKAGAAGADYLRVSRYAAGQITGPDLEDVYGKLPVADAVLKETDPLRLAAGRDGARLWLHPRDPGAEALAEKTGGRVHWLVSEARGWKGYGACLEEFIRDAIGPGGTV